MENWQRQSALQALREDTGSACLQDSELCVRELPFSGKLILHAKRSHDIIKQAVSEVIGLDLPLVPNTNSVSDRTMLWMSPWKWMILHDPSETRQLRRELETALAGVSILLSDVSDARFGIEVSGAQARNLLMRICALDLDAGSFSPGQCAQTLLARVPVLLHQVDDQPTFHLYVDRSMAHYAWDWLSDAARGLGR